MVGGPKFCPLEACEVILVCLLAPVVLSGLEKGHITRSGAVIHSRGVPSESRSVSVRFLRAGAGFVTGSEVIPVALSILK